MIKLKTPLTVKDLKKIKTGDSVLLSGVIYTARDKAHKQLLEEKVFPSFLKGQIVYYAGPAPAPKGKVVGSIGPTTSGRMDKFVKQILSKSDIIATIGKGMLSAEAKEAMVGKAVYFAAMGGAGALIAQCVKKCECVLYKDLGAEAIYKLEVENMPLIMAFDLYGSDIFWRK
ncbi:Putative fumarate hydratase [Elusimicrobium minutum Pei191]|uniref:Putative fumarate hydratase n=1 Tax=Elusimicrobium minutum (strain Pei191) TaxID=445932 RepID=B2KBV4_ELUMP|nr:FumA C-terminus/TtdB family hydratase beta subunit [Elusimicrobium minutum]ACC97858.1 Putative fumarate hydratase [Elusimicrobium minutum Pei191]